MLGVLQGLTEFLPVSSSGHLILVPWAAGWDAPVLNTLTFAVAVHLGTGLAAVVALASEWKSLLLNAFRDHGVHRQAARTTLAALIMSTALVAVIGFLLESIVERQLRSPAIVAAALMLGAVCLFAADRLGQRQRPLSSPGLLVLLTVGASQVIALIPGVSRSGITITVGRALGMGRVEVTRFSFQLMAPVILGAGVLRGLRLIEEGASGDELALLAGAALVSFAAGLAASKWLLAYVGRAGFGVFVVYRILAGAGTFALLATRM